MTARRVSDAAPLRFLLAILSCWVMLRGAFLVNWQPAGTAPETTQASVSKSHGGIRLTLEPARATTHTGSTGLTMAPLRGPQPFRPIVQGHAIAVALDAAQAWDGGSTTPAPSPPVQLAALVEQAPGGAYRHATGETDAAALAPPPARPGAHWTGSAWAFVRGGGRATALSPGGQIGGGQGGARLLYRLRDGGRLALSARVSRTIGGIRQSEASVGIDWQPVASVPVHLMAERRIAIDTGGRNAWTLGTAGGLYAVPLGGHWRFDGYAEAGVVGAHRRDLYADGAGRIARAIDLGKGRSLAVGGGLWGAAQPGAARLDLGPTAVMRLPVAGRTVSLALDWRQRTAGRARPGSGLAFTTAVDF